MNMSKSDLIKKEIERLRNIQSSPIVLCNDLIFFIDSMPEEPISKDLNAEIQYLHSIHPEVPLSELTRLAIHAAKCKEQQMMKDAIPALVYKTELTDAPYIKSYPLMDKLVNSKNGDKVRVIIIRENT